MSALSSPDGASLLQPDVAQRADIGALAAGYAGVRDGKGLSFDNKAIKSGVDYAGFQSVDDTHLGRGEIQTIMNIGGTVFQGGKSGGDDFLRLRLLRGVE